MLSAGMGYRQLPWASAVITAMTLALALLSARLDAKEARMTKMSEVAA